MSSQASPADQHRAARLSRAADGPRLATFRHLYDFEFDDFQVQACDALEQGHGVLVAAPTGSGKTVIGEFAVHLALAEGRKCFYTTPIKALSNQKYTDLVSRYSAAQVGLLTGDNSINGEAPIVVMTTEVLRNMLYAGSLTLGGLGFVVLDEVHYLADKFRGAVWEEVIIQLPESVQVVALSATVSNAEEFGDWLEQVRGGTSVVVDETRPVPLWQHMLAGRRLYDLFTTSGAVNPELRRLAQREGMAGRAGSRRPGRGGHRPPRLRPPGRPGVIERLDAEGLLPAITFIFSRAGCDAAVQQCLLAGLRLTTPEEAAAITELVAARTAGIDEADLAVLGFDGWLAGLQRGIAAHHAGLLPTFKEVVEELFIAGLIRAVFATETLALGVNMPARTVVIERLDKWNGERHADLTAGEYTQLTGRAGRRGIDIEGHAVVLWQPVTDPLAVAGLAGTRTYPLDSSFTPTYNMAVNLVGQLGRTRAAKLLESSFAQFQADRSVVGLARQAAKLREQLAGLQVSCDNGDIEDYDELRRELGQLERATAGQRSAEAVSSLERLRPGDIVSVPAGRQRGIAVVLQKGRLGNGDPAPLVLTATRHQVKRLSVADFPGPVRPIERIRIPSWFSPRSASDRRDLASTVRNRVAGIEFTDGDGADDLDVATTGADGRGADDRGTAGGGAAGRGAAGRSPAGGGAAGRGTAGEAEMAALRRRLRKHSCHDCPDLQLHLRDLARRVRLENQAAEIERQVSGKSQVLGRTFRRVCSVLDRLGYISGDSVTDHGRMLAALYTELDLLAAECLRRGTWSGLSPAELAACVSALTFESRRPEDAGPPRLPHGRAREVLADMTTIWGELTATENEQHLSFLREPDLGLAWAVHSWARGTGLEKLVGDDLGGGDLGAGDFVRAVRQLMDLLGQIAVADAGGELAATARKAIGALNRGVVAYSSVG
jgi:ATP-dependent RNA helicase HelY